MKKFAVILLFATLLTPSCRLLNSIVHDDEVVAKVGKAMLYRHEVEDLIPEGTSSDDSLRLVMQYINTWASDQVFLDIAESQLSKSDKDVTKELEAYRRSLLKYRYEQQYINDRLDTTVTDAEINEYYNSHSATLVLASPIVKARLLRTTKNSPNLKAMKSLMSSGEEDALWNAENMAMESTDVFTGYGDKWIDVKALARDMDVDPEKITSTGAEKFVEVQEAGGMMAVAYIVDMMNVGETAPIEYCTNEITDMIISTRKRRLVQSLEQELLTSARDKGKFVIY